MKTTAFHIAFHWHDPATNTEGWGDIGVNLEEPVEALSRADLGRALAQLRTQGKPLMDWVVVNIIPLVPAQEPEEEPETSDD